MSAETDSDTVEMRADVPRELVARWRALYPYHGMVRWSFITMLEEMVKAGEARPSIREEIRKAIYAKSHA